MVTSMTGFGQGKKTTDYYTVTVDIRTVNHRFFDFHIRIPQSYLRLEEKIRKLLQKHILRGRIDCYITIENYLPEKRKLQIDWKLIDEYYQFLTELKDKFNLKQEISLDQLTQREELINFIENEDENDTIGQAILEATEEAVLKLREMRQLEGAELKKDIDTYLNKLKNAISVVESFAPEATKQYEEKIYKKVSELTNGIFDESRIITEVAIIAEKTDIQEEITRLKSHHQQFQEMLHENVPVGRKMDFLLQEMNREINTIGSKANQTEISKIVVEMKSVLEKLREQVQNIE